jgi:dienelactone hydrolase
MAFESATVSGLAAAIAFYGGNIAAPLPSGEPEVLADADAIRAPLLLAFGGKDDYITAEMVERIRTTLAAAHKDFQIKVYSEQGHAFFRDSSAALETSKDVADAWNLVQTFLKNHVGP